MKSSATSLTPDLKEVLRSRLGYNEPVLSLLPEVINVVKILPESATKTYCIRLSPFSLLPKMVFRHST